MESRSGGFSAKTSWAANNAGMNHAPLFALALASSCAAQQPATNPAAPPPPPVDWKTLEAPLLTHQVQLTKREQFVKAGEAYFSPDGKWVIFQAGSVPEEGKDPDPFYAMFVAKLTRDRSTDEVTGPETPVRVSPDGSANTCGWFHPTQPGRVIFGSTLVHPAEDQQHGFQVGTRSYKWMFPAEMEVVGVDVEPLYQAMKPQADRSAMPPPLPKSWQGTPTPVFTRPNYDAECSYSADGRFILYTHLNDPQSGQVHDADIWVYDTKTQQQHCVVKAPGYDGGPFFSPDGKSICYRSDRKGDDLLQLYVADLKFDKDGVPVGIQKEYQLTSNQSVNWAPYWHPSGQFLI